MARSQTLWASGFLSIKWGQQHPLTHRDKVGQVCKGLNAELGTQVMLSVSSYCCCHHPADEWILLTIPCQTVLCLKASSSGELTTSRGISSLLKHLISSGFTFLRRQGSPGGQDEAMPGETPGRDAVLTVEAIVKLEINRRLHLLGLSVGYLCAKLT